MKTAKRILVALLAVALCFGAAASLTSCKKQKKMFTILGLAGGRGEKYVEDLVAEFKKTYDGDVRIVMKPTATIEDEFNRMTQAGDYPDLIILNNNMPKTSVEKLIQNRNLEELTDLLDQTVAGEEEKLGDKLIGGILNNYSTRPYGDGKTYLLPAFYSPTGLFYDSSRFGEGKYTLPATWDEFYALGGELNDARTSATETGSEPYLFTYPTAGYFDSVFYATLAAYAGDEKYNRALGFADGIWEDADVKAALGRIVGLKPYLLPSTAANANKDNFSKNQQAVIGSEDGAQKGTALFMPNGDWLPGEMADTTPEGFKWGFMPVPKKDAAGDAYTTTFIETMMIHKKGGFKEQAKAFIKLYFSDKGAEIVAKANGAIIPTASALKNAKANGVTDATIEMYDMYNAAKAVVGNFAATGPVTDLKWADVLLNDLNQNVFAAGITKDTETLVNEWSARLEAASDKMRSAILK